MIDMYTPSKSGATIDVSIPYIDTYISISGRKYFCTPVISSARTAVSNHL
jgi:hypothetical protein